MIVIIDNHDSFTYNLVHYFEQLDSDIRVYQNSQTTASEIAALSPELVVLSPGPGHPAQAGATRETLELLSGAIPILGVCLGHQTIIEHFGGRIVKGRQPMHGKVSLINHDQSGIYKDVPTPTKVTRYHSLIADKDAMPKCLRITALSEEGIIMGVQHVDLPITGIQFHPESILTEDGFTMLKNCYAQARVWKENPEGSRSACLTLT